MRQFINDSWNGVMNYQHNPLKNINDLQVRHLVLQVLAWMWCLVFAFSVGSWTLWGISVVTHILLIAGIVVTVGTFATAQRAPESFNFLKGYNGRGPGGEHE